MSCSNCFNGCTEITSDQCVRYTGIDVPVLGIKNGDSLSYVEQALIEFLTVTLDGTGIFPIIDSQIICKLVKDNLPTCGNLTVNDFIAALVKSACQLQVQVDALIATTTAMNAAYDIKCLTGVTSTSGVHPILQAVITKLCIVEADLAALAINVSTNYVKLADLNTLIAAYLNSNTQAVAYKNRMIPYAVVEYYGSLSGFDQTGKGTPGTVWEDIYICNGNNGTPDRRGRVGVGTNDGSMGGNALASDVNPSTAGNPSWALNSVQGLNTITLTTNQIPSHVHTATANSVVTPNPHSHGVPLNLRNANDPASSTSNAMEAKGTPNNVLGLIANDVNLVVSTTVTVAPSASTNNSHINYQPGIGCYYIQYRP